MKEWISKRRIREFLFFSFFFDSFIRHNIIFFLFRLKPLFSLLNTVLINILQSFKHELNNTTLDLIAINKFCVKLIRKYTLICSKHKKDIKPRRWWYWWSFVNWPKPYSFRYGCKQICFKSVWYTVISRFSFCSFSLLFF